MNEQRRLEQLAFVSLTEAGCPDTDQLAAYMLGGLTGAAQLAVAAHVRACPLCQHDMAVCRPPEPRPQLLIARLLPLSLADGRRSAGYTTNIRHYVAADLAVDLVIAPPTGDLWRVTGQVRRAGEGLPERQAIARSGRRRYVQTSDEQGFFTFDSLPAGRYTLSVTDGQVLVQIRNLTLTLDDT